MVEFSKLLNWLPAAIGLGVTFPNLVLPAAATATAIGLKALANQKARRIELNILDQIDYGPWRRIRAAAYSLDQNIRTTNADTFIARDPYYFNYRATQIIHLDQKPYLFIGYRLRPVSLTVSRIHPISQERMENAVFLDWIGIGMGDSAPIQFNARWIEKFPVGSARPWRMPQFGDLRRFEHVQHVPVNCASMTPVEAGFLDLIGKSMFAGCEGLPEPFVDMYDSPESQFEADLLRHAIHHGLVRS